jgi:site-specific recombinase XerC
VDAINSMLPEMLSPYENFKYALRSKDVQRQYPSLLDKFLNFLQYNGDLESKCKQLYMLGKENNSLLQSHIIKFCIYQKRRIDSNEISEGTLRNYLKPLKLFFEMNDITLPWKKIIKGLSSPKQAADDRCPTVEEIKKLLLDYPDRRLKVIVLVMLSSGVRVGAWNWLKWKHVIPVYDKNNNLLAAKLQVYAGEDEEYFSFVTPEAYSALKDYMDFRQLHGEKINGESWLIRDTWQKIDKQHGHRIGMAKFPKKMDSEGIRRMIYDAWKIQGVIENIDSEKRGKF